VGVISQTLVKRKDGRGRIAAYEALVATNAIRNLIRENKSYQINSMIQTGMRQKMITLDQSMANLVARGLVAFEDAVQKAKDPGEFKRLVDLGIEADAAAVAAGAPPPFSSPAPVATPFPDSEPKEPMTPQQQQAQGGLRGQPWRPGAKKE